MAQLNVDMKGLESLIQDTQKKLEASEGDRDFLLAELQRLRAEKAELEKQFNNLASLRDQYVASRMSCLLRAVSSGFARASLELE